MYLYRKDNISKTSWTPKKHPVQFVEIVGFQLIWVCYQKLDEIYTVWDIYMKLVHKLLHRMVKRSCKFQGCSLIYTGMATDLDVPVLLLTLGMYTFTQTHLCTQIQCHIPVYVEDTHRYSHLITSLPWSYPTRPGTRLVYQLK